MTAEASVTRIPVFDLKAQYATLKPELDDAALRVSDNGDGMTAEQLTAAFEPGHRSRHGGSGMGLYIAHTLARRCGWNLALDSEAGEGTTATLRFS